MGRISSAQAITAFSLATGIASGLAVAYLATKHAKNEITTESLVGAIVIGVGATIGASLLLKRA